MIDDKLIFAEMLAHVPIDTHRDPKTVLVIGDYDAAVTKQLTLHRDIDEIVILQSQECELDIFGNTKCTAITQQSVEFLTSADPASFDVVILNDSLNDPIYDAVFYGLINRVLKQDGLFATVSPSAVVDQGSFEDLAVKVGEYFKIVMPSFYIQSDKTQNILVASKKYHPTADLILQRADLIEGLYYYNSDTHIASFALPVFVKKRFKNSIKV